MQSIAIQQRQFVTQSDKVGLIARQNLTNFTGLPSNYFLLHFIIPHYLQTLKNAI